MQKKNVVNILYIIIIHKDNEKSKYKLDRNLFQLNKLTSCITETVFLKTIT